MSLRSRNLQHKHFNVSFPDDRIVQVTLNRPDKLNCVDQATSKEIAEIWELFDQDESLLVGIITGNGRAFCTGADLGGRLDTIAALSYPRLTRYQNGTT
jgi:enoyl-CoA hydratase/carnithine racemase